MTSPKPAFIQVARNLNWLHRFTGVSQSRSNRRSKAGTRCWARPTVVGSGNRYRSRARYRRENVSQEGAVLEEIKGPQLVLDCAKLLAEMVALALQLRSLDRKIKGSLEIGDFRRVRHRNLLRAE